MNKTRSLFAKQCRSVAESIEQGDFYEARLMFPELNALARTLAISKPIVGVERNNFGSFTWILSVKTGYRILAFYFNKPMENAQENVESQLFTLGAKMTDLEKLPFLDAACDALYDWAYQAEEEKDFGFPYRGEQLLNVGTILEIAEHEYRLFQRIHRLFQDAGIDLLEDCVEDPPRRLLAFMARALSFQSIADRVGYKGKSVEGLLGAVEQWTAKLQQKTGEEKVDQSPKKNNGVAVFGSEYRLNGEASGKILTAEAIADRFSISKSSVSRKLKPCSKKDGRKYVYKWKDVKKLADEKFA